MSLTNSLVREFAQLTVPEPSEVNGKIVYGTVHVSEGNIYVTLDGSTLLTPAQTTVLVSENERVSVLLQGHTVLITGNATNNSARITDVKDEGATVRKEFNKTLEGYEVRITKTEEGLTTQTEKTNRLQITADGLSEKITKVQSDLDSTVSEVNDLSITAQGLKATISSVKETADGNTTSISSLTATSSKLSTQITEVDEKANKLQSGIKELADSITLEVSVNGKTSTKIKMGSDGIIKLTGDVLANYINVDELFARVITITGALLIKSADGTGRGQLGAITGSTGTTATYGIGFQNREGNCESVATDSGVRISAGDYEISMTANGVGSIVGNGATVHIYPTGTGAKGAGMYITGPLYHRNNSSDEWKAL